MNKKKHKSIYFLSFVLFLLIGVVFFQISSTYSKTIEKEKELSALQEELTIEKEKKIYLEEQFYYVQTDEFIKKKAQEEFNLIQEGEILFILDDEHN